jgi:hypothetical protein
MKKFNLFLVATVCSTLFFASCGTEPAAEETPVVEEVAPVVEEATVVEEVAVDTTVVAE